jgi:ribosomal protein S27E
MTTHELDLLENAVDSLAEALAKVEDGDNGEPKAYKFAVLHMAHFVELVFKHHIASKHALLIYKDPFAAKVDRNKTITLWDAINFINNEAADTVSPALKKDLDWLKRLRNEIEHHKFRMEVPEVRATIGRLFRSVLEFLEQHTDIELESLIPESTMETFQVLSDEYEFKLRTALQEAEAFEEAHPIDHHHDPDARPVRLECENCGNPTLLQNDKSSTGYRCLVCDNEDGDNIPASCDICGVESTQGELDAFRLDDGTYEYRCYHCSGRYLADKDD